MAIDIMKFEEPYSQYIGKWFENIRESSIKLYILDIKEIKGSYEKVQINRILISHTSSGIRQEWGGEWWLKPTKPLGSDLKDAIKVIFKQVVTK